MQSIEKSSGGISEYMTPGEFVERASKKIAKFLELDFEAAQATAKGLDLNNAMPDLPTLLANLKKKKDVSFPPINLGKDERTAKKVDFESEYVGSNKLANLTLAEAHLQAVIAQMPEAYRSGPVAREAKRGIKQLQTEQRKLLGLPVGTFEATARAVEDLERKINFNIDEAIRSAGQIIPRGEKAGLQFAAAVSLALAASGSRVARSAPIAEAPRTAIIAPAPKIEMQETQLVSPVFLKSHKVRNVKHQVAVPKKAIPETLTSAVKSMDNGGGFDPELLPTATPDTTDNPPFNPPEFEGVGGGEFSDKSIEEAAANARALFIYGAHGPDDFATDEQFLAEMEAYAAQMGYSITQVESPEGGIATTMMRTVLNGQKEYAAYVTVGGVFSNIQLDLGSEGDILNWFKLPEGATQIAIQFDGARPYYYALDANGRALYVLHPELSTVDEQTWVELSEDYTEIGSVELSVTERAELALDPYYFSAEDLTGYTKLERTSIEVGGVPRQAIVGTKEDGSQTTLAMEVMTVSGEVEMARVSEYIDPLTGMAYRVFINPTYDLDADGNPSRIRLRSGSAVAREFFLNDDFGLINAGVYQSETFFDEEITAEQLRLRLPNDPIVRLLLYVKSRTPSGDPWKASLSTPVEADLSLPVELIAITSEAELLEMPPEVLASMTYLENDAMPSGATQKDGAFVWVAPDGHVQLYSIFNLMFENGLGYYDQDPEFQAVIDGLPIEFKEQSLRKFTVRWQAALGLLSSINERNPRIYYDESKVNWDEIKKLIESIFEVLP